MQLKIVRGTTKKIYITIYDDNGDIYKIDINDKLIFGIKQNYNDNDYILVKRISASSEDGDGYLISLTPEETNLIVGRYYFDIGLQTAGGDYYMITKCDICEITPAVTQKE